jgi:hypothetical protein
LCTQTNSTSGRSGTAVLLSSPGPARLDVVGLDHLGVEAESGEQVGAATERLSDLGLRTDVQHDTTCCYAVQDKVWVRGPGREPWEVYVVKDDSATYGADPDRTAATCCQNTGPVTGPAG